MQCILSLSKVTLLLFLYRAIFDEVMTISNMGAFFWDIIYVFFSFHVYVKTTNLASLTRPIQFRSIVQLALKTDIK